MSTETVDTLVIGGGLSGLYAACLLNAARRSFVILEARDRLGGRILSSEHQGFFSDLGPSWYWPDMHPRIAHLIQVLGLRGYRQFETGMGRFQRADGTVHTVGGFPMNPPSWRLHGGMQALIAKLCEAVPEEAVRLRHPVCKIEKEQNRVSVCLGEPMGEPWGRFRAGKVILALPSRLAAATILFEPDLSFGLTQAMLKTGTWMAGQAKFCALYEEPFWRGPGFSGQAFSERGPMSEIHDGSNDGRPPYGLTGFVGVPAVGREPEKPLIQAILQQLCLLYGESAARPEAMFYKDWAREPFTATPHDQAPMVEHPCYRPPAGRTSMWDGRVHFAGTETSSLHGGYLEGALEAAERAVRSVVQVS